MELSALLYALAEGGVRPPRQWMTACLAATYARMGSCSGQVRCGLGRGGLEQGGQQGAGLCSAGVQHGLAVLTPPCWRA